MGKMIYTSEKCKNPKRKPGWQKAAQEEAEWLARINGMKAFSTSKYKPTKPENKKVTSVKTPVVNGALVGTDRPRIGKSLGGFAHDTGTKVVIRPEIAYKGNDELIERERKARERKFNVAPAYNKGPDQFVTEEHLVTQLSGNKRRS